MTTVGVALARAAATIERDHRRAGSRCRRRTRCAGDTVRRDRRAERRRRAGPPAGHQHLLGGAPEPADSGRTPAEFLTSVTDRPAIPAIVAAWAGVPTAPAPLLRRRPADGRTCPGLHLDVEDPGDRLVDPALADPAAVHGVDQRAAGGAGHIGRHEHLVDTCLAATALSTPIDGGIRPAPRR